MSENDLFYTRPELILSFSSLFLLLAAAWFKNHGRVISYIAIAPLLAAGFYAFTILTNEAFEFGGDAFYGQYRADGFSSLAKLLIYVAAAITLVIAPRYLEKKSAMKAEFPVLILLACVGMGLMVSAVDLLTLYIGLELNSLAAYVLASFARDDEKSSEAGLKYFILGGLASGILLFGISLVYGFTGSTSFLAINDALSGDLSMGATFAIVFVLAGMAFKISAAPFHMWTPDVYEGAPTPVTAFFASAPKVAATALLVRIAGEAFTSQIGAWQQIIIVVAIMSIIVGALGAIGQKSLKRLLAYSSINNIGFILIGLAAATQAGVAALLVYLIIYLAMTLGGFICLMQLEDKDGVMRDNMDDVAGLSKHKPLLAAAFMVIMFSLAGIPPMFGFAGKLQVFQAAVAADLLPLAVIGIAASVIGAFYYLKVIKVMYFDDQADIIVGSDSKTLIWIGGLLALFISPLGWLAFPVMLEWTEVASAFLFVNG